MDSHGDCLYRYALLRVRVPELAAELVQETFLEALRGWERFAGRSETHLARRNLEASDRRPSSEDQCRTRDV